MGPTERRTDRVPGPRPRSHATPPLPQSELQRVLPALPRHTLGGRHLLPRRSGRGAGARALEPQGSLPRCTYPALLDPSPGAAALCGLVYLFARLRYFKGYSRSAQQR